MTEQLSIDVLIDYDFIEEVVKEAGYDNWLQARHEEICEAVIAVYLKRSKERARLKRLDEKVKKKLNFLKEQAKKQADFDHKKYGMETNEALADMNKEIEYLESLYK
jgi:DNA relaxase NicK